MTAREDAHAQVAIEDVTEWWSTSVSDIEPGVIRLRGYPVEQLIGGVSFVDMIWLMVRGELATESQSALLELALVSAVDHGPQAPSISAARMAATCGVGLNNAVATGVNLLGDVHGGAGQQCMGVLAQIVNRPEAAREQAVGEVLADLTAAGRHVPGFGHRFHPVDPRRDPLLQAVQEQVDAGLVDGRFLRAALEIERQLAGGRAKPVPMNIDGATAVIYSELGFEPQLGRGLFVLSRSVGILAHAWEETQSGQRIKGPMPPPLLPAYDGPPPRDVPKSRDKD